MDDVTFKNAADIKHEFGSLDVNDFVQRLAQEGIKDVKVEPGPNGIIIHLVSTFFLMADGHY